MEAQREESQEKKVQNTESNQPIKTESNADNAQNKLINILLIKS